MVCLDLLEMCSGTHAIGLCPSLPRSLASGRWTCSSWGGVQGYPWRRTAATPLSPSWQQSVRLMAGSWLREALQERWIWFISYRLVVCLRSDRKTLSFKQGHLKIPFAFRHNLELVNQNFFAVGDDDVILGWGNESLWRPLAWVRLVSISYLSGPLQAHDIIACILNVDTLTLQTLTWIPSSCLFS